MDLFAARAYEHIAIDDLAAATGISKGLLYHYFRGKRDFYVQTIRAASLRLRRLSEPDRRWRGCAPPSTRTSTISRSTALPTPPSIAAGSPSRTRSAASSCASC
jgi:AcrR family transcriptional regulator